MLVRTCYRTWTTAGKERGMERCDTIHDAISNRTTVPTTSLPLELWPLTSEVVIQAQGLHSRHLVLPPSILRVFGMKHGRVFFLNALAKQNVYESENVYKAQPARRARGPLPHDKTRSHRIVMSILVFLRKSIFDF